MSFILCNIKSLRPHWACRQSACGGHISVLGSMCPNVFFGTAGRSPLEAYVIEKVRIGAGASGRLCRISVRGKGVDGTHIRPAADR